MLLLLEPFLVDLTSGESLLENVEGHLANRLVCGCVPMRETAPEPAHEEHCYNDNCDNLP